MANFACMDNMFDFDLQTVDKGCFVDQNDLMAWFNDDQPPFVTPQQDRGYNGLFSSFFEETTQHTNTTSPLLEELKEEKLLQINQEQEPPQEPAIHHHLPKCKKRRNQQKKVVKHVKAEEVSSDLWAWRKYGQKPIKGSSFPRSYYRCSSSKGCIARKLVERSNSDPGTFIVTYTGEHSHSHPTRRSSLAGSTRSSTKATSPSSTTKQKTLAEEEEVAQLPMDDNYLRTTQIEDDWVFSEEMVMGWGGELEIMADQWPWILP